MSTYAIIELERSGATDQAPQELDPEQQYVYGQGFHSTWSLLDHIAELNGWQPLSSFYVGLVVQKSLERVDRHRISK
jgi:hypothetical protein